MKENIRGKIIRIVSRDTVVINLGSEDGINSNTIFRILGKPEKIINPDTNEELGEITLIKARVKATMVSEKYSVASSSWTETSTNLLSSLFSNKIIENELNVKEGDIEAWKVVTEDSVVVGDEVETTIDINTDSIEKSETLESDEDNPING